MITLRKMFMLNCIEYIWLWLNLIDLKVIIEKVL